MKTVSNTVTFDCSVWEDPGDYPNAVAASPLPSFAYCEYGGVLVFAAENDEERDSLASIDEWFTDWVSCASDSPLLGEMPCGWNIRWKLEVNGSTVTAIPVDAILQEEERW